MTKATILASGLFTKLFGHSDNDPLMTTHEAESVDVLVLCDLADEFRTVVSAQSGNDVTDFINSEHDVAYAQRVRRGAFRLGSDRRWRVGTSTPSSAKNALAASISSTTMRMLSIRSNLLFAVYKLIEIIEPSLLPLQKVATSIQAIANYLKYIFEIYF